MTMQSIKKITSKIDGWLSDKEGGLLFTLAKNCSRGTIVEIGSWKGKSTIWLGKGSKAGNRIKIYAIDPHTGLSGHKEKCGVIRTFKEFKNNIEIAKVDDIIIPIVKTSKEAVKDFDKDVELMFIDGAHQYESVKLDFELWFPKVINGGFMVFHDTIGWPGPKKVVEDLVYKSRHFKNVHLVDTITYAQKVKQNTIKDCLRNRYVLFLKNICEFAYKSHLPRPIRNIGKRIVRIIH